MLITSDHVNAAALLTTVDTETSGEIVAGMQVQPGISKIIPFPVPESTLRVVIFCGGRGSSTIIRELIRWPQVNLSLLVNAYDDGLSTGELREFIPSMLGPSDFRKNLSQLLDFCSSEQYALQKILELRLPNEFTAESFERLTAGLENGRETGAMPQLEKLFRELDAGRRQRITGFLVRFSHYFRSQTAKGLSFSDCSFGNLIFAGCYLECDQSFNATVRTLSQLFGSRAQLINVSQGENRILAALKKNGEVLSREAEIVGPQSASPIEEIFFLERPLTEAAKAELAALNMEERARYLNNLSRPVDLSAEAEGALLNADLVIYGPGTQFSSLLPSYRIARDAIRRSRARAKILVANLEPDHDIQSLSVLNLADKVLELADDPKNDNATITHIFYNQSANPRAIPLGADGLPRYYKAAHIVPGEFANPAKPNVHSGFHVVRGAFATLRGDRERRAAKSLDLYVDLLDRSMAVDFLLQEFLELPWRDYLNRVRLRLNHLEPPKGNLPEHLEIKTAQYDGMFSEAEAFCDWLENGDSEFLVTLTGDGEYRLRDLLLGIQVCNGGVFGAVFGSRTQSRHQFRSAVRAAYGDRPLLRAVSSLGAFVFTAVFGLRTRVILSDPFTGFRLYRRSKLNEEFCAAIRRARPGTAAEITRRMASHGVEIAEIPVTYRTFDHFTKPAWRLWRGLRNLLGSLA